MAPCTSAAPRKARSTVPRRAPHKPNPGSRPSTAGLTNVLGVLADDKTNTLWVCQNNTGGRGGAPVVGQTALALLRLEERCGQGHVSVSQQWRRVQRHGRGVGRHGLRHRVVRQSDPSPQARCEGARPLGRCGSATGRCRWHCDSGRWGGLREHVLRRPDLPYSGEGRRQCRHVGTDRNVAAADASGWLAHVLDRRR